jgi:crossover junction endodeoxyribonuclease RuvC
LGIDPGNSGAFCVMTMFEDGTDEVVFIPMPIIRSVVKTKMKTGKTKTKTTTQLDYVSLAHIFGSLADATMFMEKVNAMPKQGVVSMFNFGQQVGALRALLHSHRIQHYEVTPQAWQKLMHVGAAATQDAKARSLIIARRLFPALNLVKEGCRFPDEGYVDALLIAEYGRRVLIQKMVKDA